MKDDVTVLLRGGLANQMFQYSLGLAMAETMSRRLYVDTTDVDGDVKRDYALGYCTPPPRHVSVAGRFATSVARSTPFWHLCGRHWLRIVPGGPRIVREQGQAFDQRVLSLRGSLILDGYWQYEEYFCRHRPLIERTFDWSSLAASIVPESLLSLIATPRSVAVHVRRGDYVREAATNAFHGVCEADYYSRAAHFIGEHVADAHYFIFSDDIDWAESHLALPGKRTFVRHDHDPAPHVDMWLMSRCRHAIIANSSYSWWAAWLTERPGKYIVAPRRWFRDASMQSITPVPSRWHVT